MSFASKMRFLLFFSESLDAPQAPPPRQSTPYGKLDLTKLLAAWKLACKSYKS